MDVNTYLNDTYRLRHTMILPIDYLYHSPCRSTTLDPFNLLASLNE